MEVSVLCMGTVENFQVERCPGLYDCPSVLKLFLLGTKGIKIPSSSSLTLHPVPLGNQTGCGDALTQYLGRAVGQVPMVQPRRLFQREASSARAGFFNGRGKITLVKEVKADLERRKRAG